MQKQSRSRTTRTTETLAYEDQDEYMVSFSMPIQQHSSAVNVSL